MLLIIRNSHSESVRYFSFTLLKKQQFLDNPREITFDFEKKENQEHQEHVYYYDDLEKVTELQVRDRILNIVRNVMIVSICDFQFPEVKDKLTISNVRLFYMGKELNKSLPFVLNKIPSECIIVVLVQIS